MPKAKAAEDWRIDGLGIELKSLSAGHFEMGSPRSQRVGKPDEFPLTMVTLSYPFWIGRYEVSRKEYQTLADRYPGLDEDPSFFRGRRMMKEGVRDFGDEPRRPVDNITWEQATNFCHVLTERARTKLPAGYEFRLPTEAEWEYACRAGTTTIFSFGDDMNKLGDYAWCQKNSGGETHPVGEKKPNAWGLHDMQGNVMEWCLDWYQSNLPGGSVTNWFGPAKGTDHVLRGGGWANDDPSNFRSADRWHQPPTANGNGYGFRIVLAPTTEWLKKQ